MPRKAKPPPFALTPPPVETEDRVWVPGHARFKGGRWVQVEGHWRRRPM